MLICFGIYTLRSVKKINLILFVIFLSLVILTGYIPGLGDTNHYSKIAPHIGTIQLLIIGAVFVVIVARIERSVVYEENARTLLIGGLKVVGCITLWSIVSGIFMSWSYLNFWTAGMMFPALTEISLYTLILYFVAIGISMLQSNGFCTATFRKIFVLALIATSGIVSMRAEYGYPIFCAVAIAAIIGTMSNMNWNR
jgi:hypothetical protein